MQSLSTPQAISQPIANNGTKSVIPETNDQTLGDISIATGFPPVTSDPLDEGGRPVKREDVNSALHLLSQRYCFSQNGGQDTFNQTVSNLIGGYPLNARLWYTDSNGDTVCLRSTKVNNTDNFVSTPSFIGTSWVIDTPSKKYVDDAISNLSSIKANLDSPVFTGTPKAPTPNNSSNDTSVATTAFVKNQIITPNLLDFKLSDHLLNDQNWLRADTFSWQSGDVYKEVYDLLVSEYNAGRDGTSGVLTYRRTPNNMKICNATSTNETELERRYNDYESTWFYLLDTTNKRFKLPRTNWGFKGIRAGNTVPGYIQETLPNIKGGPIHINAYGQNGRQGALEQVNTGASHNDSGGTGTNVSFNASWYSSVYKDGAHVVERSESMYLYFYVGQFTQTATEQTAGLNAELFNGKADVSLPSIQAPYLKQVNISGTSGVLVWSDGYCKQWGRCSASGSQTVSFVKRFKDTNYHISFSYLGANNTGGNVMDNSIETLNADSFVTRNLSRSGSIMWISCGMLASGQY